MPQSGYGRAAGWLITETAHATLRSGDPRRHGGDRDRQLQGRRRHPRRQGRGHRRRARQGQEGDRRARQVRAARRRRCAWPHRAALRVGQDERRHVRERDDRGGAWRHHDGDLVRRAARRHEPEDRGRRVSRARRARRRDRLRVPHDPRRPARGGAGEGSPAAGEGRARLAEGVHDLRPPQGRRRAAAQRAAGRARQHARWCACMPRTTA